jgi:hypothetical protein
MSAVLAIPQVVSLMVAAESGPMRGAAGGNTSYLQALTCPVPAGAITPNSVLRFGGHVNKLTGTGGGHNLKVTIAQGANEVVITQGFIGNSLWFINWRAEMTFSADRKFGFMDGISLFNQASGGNIPAAGTFTNYIAKTAAGALLSARSRSNQAAFVTYSTSPTVEAKVIDFDQACEIRFYLGAAATDTVAMNQAYAELLSPGSDPALYLPAKATLFFGHSLVEGTGSTAGNDVVSDLRGLRPGRPISNLGLGGQTFVAGNPNYSFVDRILADPRSKSLDLIIWGPENDVGSDGPTWANTVLTRLAQVMAIRRAGSKTVICNGVTSSAWNGTQIAAAQYVNTQLAANAGSLGFTIADVYSQTTNLDGTPIAGDLFDQIHRTDAAYLKIATNAISPAMTTAGMIG